MTTSQMLELADELKHERSYNVHSMETLLGLLHESETALRQAALAAATGGGQAMKMKVAPMTAPEAGKFLRKIAEMTAGNSQNWENFEAIAADLIKSAYEGGQAAPTSGFAGIGEKSESCPQRHRDQGAWR